MKWADKKAQWFKMMTCTKLFLQLKNRKAAKGREGVLDPFQTACSWQGVEVNTIVLYSNNIWVCSAGRLCKKRKDCRQYIISNVPAGREIRYQHSGSSIKQSQTQNEYKCPV